jgi:hypothetical protein
VATRRPAIPRPVVIVVLVVVATLVYLGVAAAGQTDSVAHLPAQPAIARADAPGGTALAPGSRREQSQQATRSSRTDLAATVAFAEIDGLELTLPHEEPLAVAFHEATRPEALALQPVGVLEANDNPTKYMPVADEDGPAYQVLSSRGRARPATSAVDIVVPDGSIARAPVTGEVVEVRQYVLYGGLHDWRVVIAPDSRPDLHVVMIHLHQPQLALGDRVTAGSSAIGVARLLPFASHVDYALDERHPHVHLEVKPATAVAPLDPNMPALPLEEAEIG